VIHVADPTTAPTPTLCSCRSEGRRKTTLPPAILVPALACGTFFLMAMRLSTTTTTTRSGGSVVVRA
jgi:hypothetical protein